MDFKQDSQTTQNIQSEQMMKQEIHQVANANVMKTETEQNKTERVQQQAIRVDWAQQEEQMHQMTFQLEDQSSFQSIRNRKISQLLVENQRFTKDSAEMTDVKQSVIAVDQYLNKNYNSQMTPDVVAGMEANYKLAIASCRYYREHRNPSTKSGQLRLRMVEDVMSGLYEEMYRLLLTRDKVKDKTVGEFLYGTFVGQIVTGAPETDDQTAKTAQEKATQEKQDSLTQTMVNQDLDLLEMKGDPGKLIRKKKDKNGNQKIDSPYLRLWTELQKFPKSQICAMTFEINGDRIQLLQKEDNTLYVVRNGKQFSVPQNSATLLADSIQAKILRDPVKYGSENIALLLDSMRPENSLDNSEEISRVRDVCVHFLGKISGISTDTFNNMPTDVIWGLSRQFADKVKLPQKEIRAQIQTHVDHFRNDTLINGQEVMENLQKSQKQEKEVEKSVIITKEQKEETQQKETKWTTDEEKIKDLAADLIFSKDTWTTDSLQEKPGERMQKMILKHADILGVLAADIYRKDQKAPGILEQMVDKLPLGAFEESSGSAEEIKQMLREGLEEVRQFIDDLFPKISEDPQPAPADNSFLSSVTSWFQKKTSAIGSAMVKGAKNSPEFMGTQIRARLKQLNESDTENFSKLIAMEQKIDGYGEYALQKVQDTIKEGTQSVFGTAQETQTEVSTVKKVTEKYKSQDEMSEEELKASAKELNKVMEDCLKGNSGQGQFLKLVLSQYFVKVNTMDKRAMLASAIRNAKPLQINAKGEAAAKQAQEEALASYMGGLMKGAGPLLQKMLQGLPTQSLPVSIRGAIEDMKSNLAPIPEEIVKAELFDMVQRSKGMVTQIKLQHSLGAASVGQAFLCTLYGPSLGKEGKEVVIKMLRPDVRNRMMREKDVMLDCAMQTSLGMKKTYEGQLSRILEEMDLTREASNCEKGQIYNDKEKHVQSMKVNKIIEPTVNTMVLEKAPGVTVDKFMKMEKQKLDQIKKLFQVQKKDYQKDPLDENQGDEFAVTEKNKVAADQAQLELLSQIEEIDHKREFLTNAADSWVEEGIYKHGFYHGDLHAGNIMVDDKGLTMIDFGNVTQLDEEQQKLIMQMMAAATYQATEDFQQCFHKLLGKTDEQFYKNNSAALFQVFDQILHMGSREEAGKRIGAALMKAQELGFELPASISNFSAGQLRLQNSVDELTNIREDMEKTFRKLNMTARTPEVFSVDARKLIDIYQKSDKKINHLMKVTPMEEAAWNSWNLLLNQGKVNDFISIFMPDREQESFESNLSKHMNKIVAMMADKSLSAEDVKKESERVYKLFAESFTRRDAGPVACRINENLQDTEHRDSVDQEMKVCLAGNEKLQNEYNNYRNEEKKDAGSLQTLFARQKFIADYCGEVADQYKAEHPSEKEKAKGSKNDITLDTTQTYMKQLRSHNKEMKKKDIPDSFNEVMGNVLSRNAMGTVKRLGWWRSYIYQRRYHIV